MGLLQTAQNHLVLPGMAEGSHHRGDLAMRSHHREKEKRQRGFEMDYTDTLWIFAASHRLYIKENTLTTGEEAY